MLARLICFLLGHSFDEEEEVRLTPHPDVYILRNTCARCGKPSLKVCDMRDPDSEA